MPITNYPKILKYAVGDRPYTYANKNDDYSFLERSHLNGRTTGICRRVIITGWRAVVTDSNSSAVQTNYYTVKEITGYSTESFFTAVELYSDTEYEIPESKLFTSTNHLISTIKEKYINSPFGDLVNDANLYFSKMGNPANDLNTNGDWIDWAGMDFRDMDFSEVAYNAAWVGSYLGGEAATAKSLIFDNCNLEGAILPSGINTRSRFIDGIWSYDAETTIYTDGFPVGRPVSGKVAGVSGASVLSGVGTKFLTELEAGDKFTVYNVTGTFTILSISSDTSLTIEETFPSTFNNRYYSRFFE